MFLAPVHVHMACLCVCQLYYNSTLQALHLFLADHQPDSEEGSNIELAIQTIGEAQQENLTQELIEFLMGERDDQPKVSPSLVTILSPCVNLCEVQFEF